MEKPRFVVNKIKGRHVKGACIEVQGLHAISDRTNTQSRPFEELFFEEGIPYNIVGGFRFFDRKEIKDALSYLKALANPEDSLNFPQDNKRPAEGHRQIPRSKQGAHG